VRTLWPVGTLFLLAIGLSGLLAEGLALAFGGAFVAGDAPGVTYTAERCAEYLALEPDAGTCKEAAIAHHLFEIVGYRVAAGATGAVMLVGWAVWRRRTSKVHGRSALGASFPLTVGVSLASVAAGGLLLLGLGGAVTGYSDGTGNPLSGGIVSAFLSLAFGAALWRELRVHRLART
jgi:hypothetical protein